MAKNAIAFEFRRYRFEPAKKRATFSYALHFSDGEKRVFAERVFLPRVPHLERVPRGLVTKLLESIHVMLGVSYYKLLFPARFIVPYRLSSEEAAFWNAVYQKGLGECLYRNRLDPKIVARFSSDRGRHPQMYECVRQKRSLVGIGGGKDSIVTAELLREQGKAFTPYIVAKPGGTPVIDDVLRVMKKSAVTMTRQLDRQLLSPDPGWYAGHIPISAVYAFLGFFAAVLYDYDTVVVSNEHSSNFGNLRYRGMEVNHQWSKSSEFEKLFQAYCRTNLTRSIVYFSALRPFHEIRVAKMFSKHKKYFNAFSSCNTNFRHQTSKHSGRWCGKCPKCASVFALLAPFIPRSQLIALFHKNVFADPTLLPLYQNLLGLGTMKPFDCVGTFEETQAAFRLSQRSWKNDLAIKTFLPKIRGMQKDRRIFGTQPALTIPTAFRFLGMERAVLLGYGKEGRVTRRFLKKVYPKLMIGIADQKDGPGYLNRQDAYDIAVKTPGIPKRLVTIQYTTATNLFFANAHNTVIGITASKGKSTTTSLLHAMLRQGGIRSRLLGNIGEPMLKACLRPIHPHDVFVLELSSYQLDDIEFSPHIAAVLNLFPEHMNYHGSVEAYYAAKKRITDFQGTKDIFVYNKTDPQIHRWLKSAQAKLVPCVVRPPMPEGKISLIGRHNLQNIAAAATIASLLHVSDVAIRTAIKKFQPLRHRLEDIGTYRKIRFIDDAISTTPESTIAALRALPNVQTLFLGGEDRGYSFGKLEKEIRKQGVKNIVLFPTSGKRIFRTTKGLTVLRTRSMKSAVRFAYQHTSPGAICLLSTASPSYSVWRDFTEKGKEFQHWVRTFCKQRP